MKFEKHLIIKPFHENELADFVDHSYDFNNSANFAENPGKLANFGNI